MTRDINLDSRQWLDLVFEGRNKAYGAYELREDSSNRHLLAIAVVIAAGLAILFLSRFVFSTNTGSQEIPKTETTEVTVSEVVIPQRPIAKVVEIVSAPAVVRSSVQFNKPTIVPDEIVAPENEMLTQNEMTETSAVIGTQTVKGEETAGVHPDEITPPAPTEGKIEIYVDVMPEFNGNLAQWLSNQIRYPIDAIEQGIDGRVTVRFVVEKDGSIGNVQVLKPVYPSLDREAVRVVQKMPKWKPGLQQNQAVRVYYTLPIQFKLQK